MNPSAKKTEWLLWGGLAVMVAVILAAFIGPPVKAKPLPVYGAMPAFRLTDQDSRPTTPETLRGQVWIADVIFTRCAGQCLIMSGHMKDLQASLPPGSLVKLVSFTTDPDFDTPAILKKYAARFGADDGRWIFLTGDKAALRQATVMGMKLTVMDKPPGERDNESDFFIHSAKFVLIDQSGNIRGYYDGETPEAVTQVLAAAESLARR
jgi:protein SCO1/2